MRCAPGISLPLPLLTGILGAALLLPLTARAFVCGGGPGQSPFHTFAFGLQGGGAAGADAGGRLGVELGYITGPKGLCGGRGFPFWASAGAVVDPGSGRTRLYGEAGSWLFLALGLGYGVAVAGDEGVAHSVHGFVGLPFPLHKLLPDRTEFHWGLYVMPYYRPTWFAGADPSWSHEVGLAIKLSTYDLP